MTKKCTPLCKHAASGDITFLGRRQSSTLIISHWFMQTKGKLQNDRHQKWSTYLQQFHLNIKYKIGSTNHIVDCLSRPPVTTLTTVLDSCSHETSDGPNSMRQTLTSPPPTKCWVQMQLSIISIFRMGCCVIWAIYVFHQVSERR
jgi:hypothetical protein